MCLAPKSKKVVEGVLALLAAVSCAHGPQAPGATLSAFGSAVERKDYAAAYALMSIRYRQRVSGAEFKRLLEDGGAEYAAGARTLHENAATLGARVEVALAAEESVPLVEEGSKWRLDAPPFAPFSQSTPRASLRTFIRAAEGRRYDVLLRLVPARWRNVVTQDGLRTYWEGEQAAQNRGLLRELRLHLGDRVVEEGDEAFMAYGVNHQVRFVREDGLWRIESPE